ncbi:MAG: PepSY-associated TM helix domain-containing protein [Ignavibacteriales bacterium]|nr:PepSY-associated TM helix domain-containing protein [Ignavibacteriales bacterium]
MKIRKLIRLLHRDVGYVAFGLTIIYSISGIAVNHVNDWNPNYIIGKDTLIVSSGIDSTLTSEQIVEHLTESFSITDSIKSFFRSSPTTIDIFFDKKTLSTNLKTRIAVIETVESRTVFHESNFLHLNHPKKLWTWIADLFAVALIFLAITGIFMIKGKKGISGRGKWFILIGILIPIVFLLLYF